MVRAVDCHFDCSDSAFLGKIVRSLRPTNILGPNDNYMSLLRGSHNFGQRGSFDIVNGVAYSQWHQTYDYVCTLDEEVHPLLRNSLNIYGAKLLVFRSHLHGLVHRHLGCFSSISIDTFPSSINLSRFTVSFFYFPSSCEYKLRSFSVVRVSINSPEVRIQIE